MAAFVKFQREERREKREERREKREERRESRCDPRCVYTLFLAASDSGSDSILYAGAKYEIPGLLSIHVAKI
ncbi:MAG: hypothetical protein ACRENG_20605, partial [bacterium]